MKIPKCFYKSAVIITAIVWILSAVLFILLGFENARKILGFISSIIGLPTTIINLFCLIYIIDEDKLINKTLIKAGKKDRDEWEKMKKQMEQ
jgi:ABC-type tungstate transport system substrate-binding protein